MLSPCTSISSQSLKLIEQTQLNTHAHTYSPSSSWTSYFPFSLFGAADGPIGAGGKSISSAPGLSLGKEAGRGLFFSSDDNEEADRGDHYYYYTTTTMHQTDDGRGGDFKFNFRAFERSLNSLSPSDGMLKFALLTSLHHFTKLINSILGKYSTICLPTSPLASNARGKVRRLLPPCVLSCVSFRPWIVTSVTMLKSRGRASIRSYSPA